MKIVILVMMSVVGFSQSAKVVALSEADTVQMIKLKGQLRDAQNDLDYFVQRIGERYISDSEQVIDYGTTGWTIVGSSNGISTASDARKALTEIDVWTDACKDVYLHLSYGTEAVERCQKLLNLRRKSKAEQDAIEAKEKERIAKLPKKTVYTLKDGWKNGFNFSEDYKYIVPKEFSIPSGSGGTYIYPNTLPLYPGSGVVYR